jgi:hypothetical protein
MNLIRMHLANRLQQLDHEDGFLVGRLALVVFIIGLIVIAAVIAFIIPGSD